MRINTNRIEDVPLALSIFSIGQCFRNDMICLKSLIARIVNLSKSRRTPAEILKVLWFLFAVASVSHSSPGVVPDYDRAVKRLAAALQYSRLNDCYTHHIDLLHYCLKCAVFPKDLRNRAMDLWLVESEGDVKPLLTLDCAQVVQHYLLVRSYLFTYYIFINFHIYIFIYLMSERVNITEVQCPLSIS